MTRSIRSHPLKLRLVTSDSELAIPFPNPEQTVLMPSFGKDEPTGLYDLYSIGVAMHELERELHNNAEARKRVRKVIIPLTRNTLRDMDQEAVSRVLSELALAIFSKSIEFSFEPHTYYQTDFEHEYEEYDAICLFSGGADSFVGVLDSKERYGDVLALNVRHDHSNAVNSYVARLEKNVLKPEDIPLERIDVPKQIGKGYSQTRGIVYQACAGISAFRHSSRRVVLSECGTTMYQPSFGLFDRVTYTSDPLVQSASQKLVKELLDYKLEIATPFENSTKSEMFASSRRKEQLRDTFSCISSRFGQNLGCCYGCAIRRMGFLVAGVEDCQYKYDLFSINDEAPLSRYGRGKGTGRTTDLLELMRFSLDLLIDYESIDPIKRRRIDRYHKHDLFRRFALDTFASLSIVSDNGGIRNSRLEKAFNDALTYVERSDLEKRVESVRMLSK
jgi:7-cyano-7-deazaguanine synthase in queuosine biosynthesis